MKTEGGGVGEDEIEVNGDILDIMLYNMILLVKVLKHAALLLSVAPPASAPPRLLHPTRFMIASC